MEISLRASSQSRPARSYVLLLSGTFNPPHRGHIRLGLHTANRLRQEGHVIVSICFVPVHDNYLANKVAASGTTDLILSMKDRCALLRSMLENEDPEVASICEVLDYEVSNGSSLLQDSPSYWAPKLPDGYLKTVPTAALIHHFAAHHVRHKGTKLEKGVRLALVFGADNFASMASWRSPHELLGSADVVVVGRAMDRIIFRKDPSQLLGSLAHVVVREALPVAFGERTLFGDQHGDFEHACMHRGNAQGGRDTLCSLRDQAGDAKSEAGGETTSVFGDRSAGASADGGGGIGASASADASTRGSGAASAAACARAEKRQRQGDGINALGDSQGHSSGECMNGNCASDLQNGDERADGHGSSSQGAILYLFPALDGGDETLSSSAMKAAIAECRAQLKAQSSEDPLHVLRRAVQSGAGMGQEGASGKAHFGAKVGAKADDSKADSKPHARRGTNGVRDLKGSNCNGSDPRLSPPMELCLRTLSAHGYTGDAAAAILQTEDESAAVLRGIVDAACARGGEQALSEAGMWNMLAPLVLSV